VAVWKVVYNLGTYSGHKYFTTRDDAWRFEEKALEAAALLGYRHIFKIHLELESEQKKETTNGELGPSEVIESY